MAARLILPAFLGGLIILQTLNADDPRADSSVDANQAVFNRVFGDVIEFDATFRDVVLAGQHGLRHYVDNDQNGMPEEVWFVDTASRHLDLMRPVLVRCIDEDRDLKMNGEPDTDSDLYVADWSADGDIDAVLDFLDTDGDQDADEMTFFTPGPEPGALRAVWFRDLGDDNLLAFDIGYAFDPALCARRSHFSGDESFFRFMLAPGAPAWQPDPEEGYLFFDVDQDRQAEQAVRFSGDYSTLLSIRDSLDADNDADPDDPRDYDVSVTARAPDNGLAFPESALGYAHLRGIPTGLIPRHDTARAALASLVWDRILFTWDEIDHNVDGETRADEDERWEGVIAAGTDGFNQIGAPHCGTLNKRYELARGTPAPVRVYYHPADQRVHLFGATRAWMDVDLNLDQTPDGRYAYLDTDSDGRIDRWEFDIGADGSVDDAWTASPETAVDLEWSWTAVHQFHSGVLDSAPPALFALNHRLEEAIAAKAGGTAPENPAAHVLRADFTISGGNEPLRQKRTLSTETTRFYLDVSKDCYIAQLKRLHDSAAFWAAFDEARGRGALGELRAAVEKEFALATESPDYAGWMARRSAAVTPPRRVAWRQDWVRDNIGWESERIAYRFHDGQIDVFGKKGGSLILDLLTSVDDQSEREWGQDALYVRDTPGCGGVNLYVNGELYAVRSPGGRGTVRFQNALVEETPDRVTVETVATGVGSEAAPYTVRLRATALAGRVESPVGVTVEGGVESNALELGIGLTALPDQVVAVNPAAGFVAAYGVQTGRIGPIGLAAIFPADRFIRQPDRADATEVVLRVERQVPLVYYIVAEWNRGRRFPNAPSGNDWIRRVEQIAMTVGQPPSVPTP